MILKSEKEQIIEEMFGVTKKSYMIALTNITLAFDQQFSKSKSPISIATSPISLRVQFYDRVLLFLPYSYKELLGTSTVAWVTELRR